jgi:hypothetical protein
MIRISMIEAKLQAGSAGESLSKKWPNRVWISWPTNAVLVQYTIERLLSAVQQGVPAMIECHAASGFLDFSFRIIIST